MHFYPSIIQKHAFSQYKHFLEMGIKIKVYLQCKILWLSTKQNMQNFMKNWTAELGVSKDSGKEKEDSHQ